MAILGVRIRGWKRLSVCSLIALLLVAAATMFGQSADEDEVKAAFLFNFTKFVEWPQDSASPLTICLLADDAFKLSVEQLVRKNPNVRAIHVRRLNDASEGTLCQILFVSRRERSKGVKILETVVGKPVLTVGDGREFAQMGAIMCLYSSNNRIRFAVSPARAEDAGLKISSKVLSLGDLIKNDQISER